MNKPDLRFRQVHLDFHTHEQIEGVGAAFDAEVFAATLERAHVDSVTCFGRCHHGWIYFDTQAFPEKKHPHLARNLLKEQIEACHARDIRAPIYITVQWDHFTAQAHPEWLVVDEQGCPIGTPLYQAGFYRRLCLNSPYYLFKVVLTNVILSDRRERRISTCDPVGFYCGSGDSSPPLRCAALRLRMTGYVILTLKRYYVDAFLKPHVQEVLETLPTDGFFFDIVAPMDCSCPYCRAGMEAAGLEPSDSRDRRQFGLQVVERFKRDLTAFVHRFNPDCTIFYNAGHIGPRHRAAVDAYTHFEIESLPSGHWGYLHFPMAVRYARNLGVDCLGMTGKFHTVWGDFGSFKNKAALQFECFQMLAQGAKCSIGDQLHPSGHIDPDIYDLIGSVYALVEKVEPWCRGARPLTEIGVLTPEEFEGPTHETRLPPALMGVTRMLEEGVQPPGAAHQFDVVDSASDFAAYKVIVLPDRIPISEALAAKLKAYLSGGGALVASFESGMGQDKRDFALKALGVTLKSEGTRDASGALVRGRHFHEHDYADYVRPGKAIGQGLRDTEYVFYMRGVEVEAQPGSEILAQGVCSYFDRSYRRFCSHRQAPPSGVVGTPAIVRQGRAIYFAHPIFTQYNQNAPRWCKTLFHNALALLLPEPLVRHDGPTTLRLVVNEQPDEARWLVHLLHYIPERRGQDFDVIEDVIPLHKLKVSVRTPKPVRSVVCVPQREPLAFEQRGKRAEFVLPKLSGYQVIALSF